MEVDDSRSKPVEERIENALVKVKYKTFFQFVMQKTLYLNDILVLGY